MRWNDHSKELGRHALFSPSQPGFFNLTNDEFVTRLYAKSKSGIGTEIHEWASIKIKRRHKVSSLKEAVKSIDEFIFNKYTDEHTGYLYVEGRRLLKSLASVSSDTFETVRSYVNDAVGFRMDPEVGLGFSERFFGRADAISDTGGILRIHDLKTGTTPAHIEQLMGYDAYYCLEYHVNPCDIEHELRIYQNNDVLVAKPEGPDIQLMMDRVVQFDKLQYEFEEE